MELYNFFTKPTVSTLEIEELKRIYEELKPKCIAVMLTERKRLDGQVEYSIIGQIHGSDTNVGDLDLVCIFDNIEYFWLDATMPTINNFF